jgi:4-aminobutyrate--pyruvate transaminase
MKNQGNSAASRDIANYLHPYTNLRAHEETGPLVITRGEGIRVFDDSGNGYIEGMAGLWCTSLGFGEERLVEAAVAQMRKLPFYHGFGGKVPNIGIELAERLIGLAPVPMSKVFFANSGSEAVDTAIKLIRYYNNAKGRPNKKKLISRTKAYHGVTLAAASLTRLPINQTDFDLPIPGIVYTDCPHYYRFAEEGESEESFSARLANNLEKLILDEGPETVAAFFAEPVQGAGGVIVPPAGYFEKVQKILKKYDILFVADEVICGFGRTGNMWGTTTFDLKPDMITMAKALSSAYLPISALMINDDVYQSLADNSAKIGMLGHGYTYGGHPVPAAVAVETLNIYEERDTIGHVQTVSPILQNALKEYENHPLVGEVRGIGLVAGVELVQNKETKQPFDMSAKVGVKLVFFAQSHGLISRAIGDTIAFSPPLIITENEIDEMVGIFGKALDETESWARSEGLLS